MTLKEKLLIIDEWLILRRRVYGIPGHFNNVDKGRYEIMSPIGDAKGLHEIFNIRLEDLPHDELEKTIKEIKNYASDNLHIEWPFACSDRLHLAIRGKVPVHPEMDGLVFGIMKPDQMPCYPENTIEIKKVETQKEFALWCNINPRDIWVYDENKHFHLVEEGKMNCFIAFVEGKHAAVSLILNYNGVTALDYSFVLPEYKQKEIEAALNQYSIKSAFEMGSSFVIGYAHPAWHPDSYEMFKKLGFSLVTSE
jgi:hypothetical protein